MARSATTSDPFNAIAEPRRRAILDFLASAGGGEGDGGDRGGGEHAVNDIVASLRLAQPQVSKHLRVLREVDLVRVRESGRCRFYSLNGARLRPIHDWTQRFERFWEGQLNRIKERAESQAAKETRSKSRTSNKRR